MKFNLDEHLHYVDSEKGYVLTCDDDINKGDWYINLNMDETYLDISQWKAKKAFHKSFDKEYAENCFKVIAAGRNLNIFELPVLEIPLGVEDIAKRFYPDWYTDYESGLCYHAFIRGFNLAKQRYSIEVKIKSIDVKTEIICAGECRICDRSCNIINFTTEKKDGRNYLIVNNVEYI